MSNKIPKWFKAYLENNKTSFNAILTIAIITGITTFGLPEPPIEIKNFFNQYPWFRWIMLWLLIYQGGGGGNLMITNFAFSIVFLIHNLDWKYIKNFSFKYKKYLVISPLLLYFFN